MMMIETERLILRQFGPEDKEDLKEYLLQRSGEEFERITNLGEEKLERELAKRMAKDEFLAVELKASHKVIGNIYMGIRDFNTRELGFLFNHNYHRQGYAKEAAKAAVQYFFLQGTRRISAECCPDNIASWHTLESIGMKREGHLRQNISFYEDEKGRPIYWDTYVYGLLAEDNK